MTIVQLLKTYSLGVVDGQTPKCYLLRSYLKTNGASSVKTAATVMTYKSVYCRSDCFKVQIVKI